MTELEKRIRAGVEPHRGKPLALSGGVDSSLLAALAEPKFAITVALPGGERFNETEHATKVAEHLGIEHHVVTLDESTFEADVATAVRAIGRPVPHFNVFPLFQMYRHLALMGETELILGDGPDEVMCGYARDLIFHYLYGVYALPAFEHYHGLIDRVLPAEDVAVRAVTGMDADSMLEADLLMRKDMDDMSDGIARHFGITNVRPYQDDPALDAFMRDLPISEKVLDVQTGKLALRRIAAQYLPVSIAWRLRKVGGPVYPVNEKMGWVGTDGEFGKASWMAYQRSFLP